MLKKFRADLHLHTCLSPCAESYMTPLAIVKVASERGLDIIAITDHNSAENIIAVKEAAVKRDLTVLAGMEVTSSEEVHIIALFDEVDDVMRLQNMIRRENLETSTVGLGEQLLIMATNLTAYSIVEAIHSLGGLSIASHIDRESFSIISQLGFIPKDLKFDALEFSSRIERKTAESLFKEYSSFGWISSSDAHHLEDIGKRVTTLFIKEPTIAEIASALRNTEGRRVEW
jgi:hypothetical protein